MTSNAVDFFATLGRKPGDFACKSFKSVWADDQTMFSANEVWNDAITDIVVLTKGDHNVDESWTILNTSLDGEELQFPYLAIKRRSISKRLDHITKIRLVQPGEPTPVGFELIRNSISGAESSQLRQLGYLAIKRADTSSVMFIQGESMIDDICCLIRPNTAEELPTGYVSVEKTAYPNSASASAAAAGQSYFALGYHLRSPVGLCDLRYESATLDRYPAKDYKGLELPVNELPMFAFPNDLRLNYGSLNRFPLPVFFTFVFTDANGEHLYAACLRFYEVVPYADLLPVFHQVYGTEHRLEILAGSEIFCPKVICVVSKRPFYRAMRRFLRQIYSLSLSSLACPLEYFIASLVNQVPLPVEGGRVFHVMLDSALISPTSRPMAPIVFELPVSRFFPHMDLDFAGPLRCLSVDHLLAVFTLMLREAKMLFICSSNTLLTDAMESLRMLLFPMSWASCFVSRLPDALTGLLEAPGGFMIGIHVMEDNADVGDKRPGSTKSADWHTTATKNFIKNLHNSHTLMPGTYVVDLSANGLYQYDGKTSEPLSAHNVDALLKTLPLGPKQRLKLKLSKIAAEYRIGPQTYGFEEFDSAFDFQSQDDSQVTAKKWEEFPTLEVRDSFMAFMIDFLGNYTKYIIPPIEDMTVDTYRTFKEEFSVSDYLDDADVNTRYCIELLMESQMFAVLLQERSEGSHYSVVFFEQCSNLLRQLSLSAGGHGSGHVPKQTLKEVPELPAPIFELLEAECRWSALSKIMQQQILNTSIWSSATAPPSAKGHSSSSGGSGHHAPSTPQPHPHQLSMISIAASGISPLRGSSPVRIIHPVVNEKLNDLLTMHKIMKSIDVFKHVALDDVNNNVLLSIARQELDRKEELQLQNADVGPLIIPGPVLKKTIATVSSTDEASPLDQQQQDLDESEKVTYSYANGWPEFNSSIFEAAEENIHPRLKEVRSVRLYANEKMNKRMLMFIRSPAERLAFEHEGKLHNKVKLDAHEEVSSIISGILDIASVSLMMLAGRVLHLTRPTADVLQMLGVIAQIESLGLSHAINESVWRSVLACCAAGGGDLMRKIACVVFESINSVNFNPDALTYGQYIQALASKKINKAVLAKGEGVTEGDQLLVDQFVYLEEIGHTWFMQRTALIEKAQVEQEYASVMGSSVSPVAMFQKTMGPSASSDRHSSSTSSRRSSWTMSSNSPMGLDNVNSKRLVVKSNTTAAQFTGDLLSLNRSFGVFSFLRPIDLIGVSSLKPVSVLKASGDIAADDIGADVIKRLDTFYSDAAAAPSHIGRRRPSHARARNSSHTSSTVSTSHSAASPDKAIHPHHNNNNAGANGNHPSNVSPINVLSRMGSTFMGAASTVASSVNHSGTEGWSMSKRFGVSLFSKSAAASSATTTTAAPSTPVPVNTPPPAPPGAAAVSITVPGASTTVPLDDPEMSPSLRGSFLRFLPSTLNFDDEEDDSETDSRPSTTEAPQANTVSFPVLEPVVESVTESVEASSISDNAEVTTSKDTHVPVEDLPTASVRVPLKDTHKEVSTIGFEPAHDAKEDAEKAFKKASSEDDEEEDHLPPLNKRVSVVELQSKLLASFDRDIRHTGSMVGIHSCTECSCGYMMMDEEILGMWCKYQSEDIHASVLNHQSNKSSGGNNSKSGRNVGLDRSDSVNTVMRNLLAAHTIVCPQCSLEFVPNLNVHQYVIDSMNEDSTEHQRKAPFAQYVGSIWSTTVNYMSPFALRFELEEVVLKFGETVCEADWLHSHYPDLYWGVVWYANRFSVPTGFLGVRGEDHILDQAVVVGWSANVVKTKVYRQLVGLEKQHTLTFFNSSAPSDIQIIDVFPKLTTEEIVTLQELVEDKLDGSPAGMRAAMLELVKCKNLFVDAKDVQKKGQSYARIIYCTLLNLCYLFDKKKLIGAPVSSDVVRSLVKDFGYDKLFTETISWTLSKADCVEMKTTETELTKCVASKEVQAARIGFGFQF